MVAAQASDRDTLADWYYALDRADCDPKWRDGNARIQARCPAHDDHNPSLSVTAGSSRILAHCYAGCSFADILAALRAWLVPGRPPRTTVPVPVPVPVPVKRGQGCPLPTDATIYFYPDAAGQPSGAVARWDRPDGKRIAQYRASGDQWEAGAAEGLHPLYQLADVLRDTTGRVLVVEGEKCVEAVRAAWAMQIVVTWSGGVNAWERTDWTPLAGREVLLVADADDPGRAAMQAIASRLLEVGAAKIEVALPEGDDKDDIADWIEEMGASLAVEHIEGLRKPWEESLQAGNDSMLPASNIGITFPSIDAEDAMPVIWLWKHWIPKGFVTILSAPGGTGKGSVALEVALAAAGMIDSYPDGTPSAPVGGAVYYVSFEDELQAVLNARAHAFGAGPIDAIKVAGGREVAAAAERSETNDPLAVLEEMRASDPRPPTLLVIDPLVELVGTLGLNENSNAEMSQLMGDIRLYAERWQCAVLIAHHTRKGSATGAAAEASRGASAISNAARSQLRLLNGPPEDPDARMLGRAKGNLGPTGGIIRYRLHVHEFVNSHGDMIDTAILGREGYDHDSNIGLELARGADGTTTDAVLQRRDAIHKHIAEYGPICTGDLYLTFPEISERQMGAAVKRLRDQGDIESREITKAIALAMGRTYTKGENVLRVRSGEPW